MRRTSRPRRAAVRQHTARRPVTRRRAFIRMRARRAHGWLRARSRQPRACGTLSASWRRRARGCRARRRGWRRQRGAAYTPDCAALPKNAHISASFDSQSKTCIVSAFDDSRARVVVRL
eukprot:2414116-Prymnesium_polylepis.1